MTSAGEVYFGLRGDFIPSDVTNAIGLSPSRTRLAGEAASGMFPKCSHWNFSSGKKEADYIDVYDLSHQVIAALAPYEDRIAAAIEKWNLNATLQVVLWITMDESVSTPAIGFDADVIRCLERVGDSIDIDTYRVAPEISEQGAAPNGGAGTTASRPRTTPNTPKRKFPFPLPRPEGAGNEIAQGRARHERRPGLDRPDAR